MSNTTHKETQVDLKRLRALAAASTTAKALAKHFSTRERSVKGPHFHTYLFRLRKELIESGVKLVDKDFTAFFVGLDKLGIGRVVQTSTGGKPRFFAWDFHPKDIGLSAIGEDVDIRETASQRVERRPANYNGLNKSASLKPATPSISTEMLQAAVAALPPEQRESFLLKLMLGRV